MADADTSTAGERYYEVKEDLKALFQNTGAKPFRFFGADDEQEAEDPLQYPAALSKSTWRPDEPTGSSDEDETESNIPVQPHTFTTGPVSHQRFFFTPDDPRLEQGKRFLSMTKAEKEASLEEWKTVRPQIAADFKKLKKQANRKRKFTERNPS